MRNREVWMAAALVELSETVVVDFDESGYAGVLTARLAELLAPAEVGVAIAGQRPEQWVVTGSTARARALVVADAGRGDGVCRSCIGSGEPILNLGLAAMGERWPGFAAEAEPAGFGLVSALPMSRHGDAVGAIAVLGSGDGTLGEPERDLALMLGAAATIGLRQQRALVDSNRTADQLQHALDSRVQIEQAKGVVAALLSISPDEAFELLRSYSRRHNRRLADVAQDAINRRLPVSDDAQRPRRGGRA